MSRPANGKTSSKKRPQSQPGWEALTWDDVRAWAGSKGFSKGRSYTGNVSRLQATDDGRLLAWVQGTRRYATTVELKKEGKLESVCSCPVGWDACKHAVAVVLSYLEALQAGTEVPQTDDDDPRWAVVRGAEEAEDEFDDEDDDDDFDAEDEEDDSDEWSDDDEGDVESGQAKSGSRRALRTRGSRVKTGAEAPLKRLEKQVTRTESKRAKQDASLREFLLAKSHEQLVELLMSVARNEGPFRETLLEQQAVQGGDVAKLVKQARREIQHVTAQDVDYDSWNESGDFPDYAGVQRRLATLLANGHADAVVELGRELLTLGIEQIGQAHDEWESASAFGEALEVVFEAVVQSSLTACQKLLFAIDAGLADDYSITETATEHVFQAQWSPADWSEVADELARRLNATPKTKLDQDHQRSYQRERLSRWLVSALEDAGRTQEVLSVLETEARANGGYERLVRHLLAVDRRDDARRWAMEGLAKTPAELAGSIHTLKTLLRELAEQDRDWPTVAAFRAEEFFKRPNVESFGELLTASQKAKCRERVEAAARTFLETGERPKISSGKKTTVVDWPLPQLDLPESQSTRRPQPRSSLVADQPHWNVLLELAIKAKQPDEAWHWFERMREQRTNSGWGDRGSDVAHVVADKYPDRALAIWTQLADHEIARTSPAAYEVAVGHLRKIRDLLKKLDRSSEWTERVAKLRETHRRKSRFIEALNGLSGRSIIKR